MKKTYDILAGIAEIAVLGFVLALLMMVTKAAM